MSLLIFIINTSVAMATDISGLVKYPDVDEPMIGATVRLFTEQDSVFIKGTVTNIDGRYTITDLTSGKYILTVSMIGSVDTYNNIEISSDSKEIIIPTIIPKQNSVLLQEAVVTGVASPVITKQDTIEFNAGSYHTAPNSVVEDLLKRLPGVEVGTDGSISSGGKTITKVLVNGKEFFSDDPKMATKNLPADMVDKIQVVDRKSDLARLTGIDDGEEETVINLTVKKNMQNGIFGTVTGGYGNKNRYQLGANISYFSDGNQITLIGGANNINDMKFSDRGSGRFNRIGGNEGIVDTQNGGINFNLGKTDDLRFGGNILYTHSNRKNAEKYYKQYLFSDSTAYENGISSSNNQGDNLRADFRLQWNIDQFNTIDFRPRFSYFHNTSKKTGSTSNFAGDLNCTPINKNLNKENNLGNSYDLSGELIYSHKFKQKAGRSISMQVKYSLSNTKQRGFSFSDLLFFLKEDDNEIINQYIDNHNWSNSIDGQLSWTEPLGNITNGNFLNFAYQINYKWNDADRLTYNLPDYEEEFCNELLKKLNILPDDAVLDTELSNRFRNSFSNQRLQISYKRLHALYNIEAGLMVTPSMSRSIDLLNENRNISTRWVWNVSPFMRFRYKFNKQKNLSIDYKARTNQATITQMQPVADNTDPLNIIIGNPNLKPTFTQNITARYSDFNANSQQSLTTILRASLTFNNIVSSTTFDQITGGRITTYNNVSGVWQIMGMAMINRPIATRHWRMSASAMINYNRDAGYNNGELNRSGNLLVRPEFSITYGTDFCQVELRPRYSLQYAHNSMTAQPNRIIHNYGGSFNGSVFFPFGLSLDTDLTFTGTSGYSKGYDTNQWMWNVELSYSFLKNKNLTLGFKIYDLLGEKKNISRTVTANYILDKEYDALTRYFMFNITYKFNSMKSKNIKSDDIDAFEQIQNQPIIRSSGTHKRSSENRRTPRNL